MTRTHTCVCWLRRGTTKYCTTSTTARESADRRRWPAWWGSGCQSSREAKAGRSEAMDGSEAAGISRLSTEMAVFVANSSTLLQLH